MRITTKLYGSNYIHQIQVLKNYRQQSSPLKSPCHTIDIKSFLSHLSPLMSIAPTTLAQATINKPV